MWLVSQGFICSRLGSQYGGIEVVKPLRGGAKVIVSAALRRD
jgi:hypothetical protein